MILRDLNIGDLVELEDKAQFPVGNLVNKPLIVQKTFEDEDGIIGSIFVSRTAELIAIFNERSSKDKIKIMKQLPDILYRELAPQGYRDIHAFIKDPEFAEILIKHFGFDDISGRAIVRNF